MSWHTGLCRCLLPGDSESRWIQEIEQAFIAGKGNGDGLICRKQPHHRSLWPFPVTAMPFTASWPGRVSLLGFWDSTLWSLQEADALRVHCVPAFNMGLCMCSCTMSQIRAQGSPHCSPACALCLALPCPHCSLRLSITLLSAPNTSAFMCNKNHSLLRPGKFIVNNMCCHLRPWACCALHPVADSCGPACKA